ncbi:MAG: HpcH/HpaI aldolase family protein [Chloroflexota bacterium]
MIQKNRMKAKIKAGEPAFGVSITFPAPELVEMVANGGFDWIMIDAEHGSHSPTDVYTMTLACERWGVTPLVRPQTNQPDVLLRYLDRGAMGVQVPHVNTKEEAQRAVDAVRFHPEGQRGLGGGRLAYGLSLDEFTRQVNEETLVCVQIEHQEGLDNLDEILTVDGVDVFFIGPSDLSQSMGYPGQRKHPVVQQAVDDAFARIKAAGKASGTPGGPDDTREHIEKGVLYHYTHIPTFVAHYSEHFFRSVRG